MPLRDEEAAATFSSRVLLLLRRTHGSSGHAGACPLLAQQGRGEKLQGPTARGGRGKGSSGGRLFRARGVHRPSVLGKGTRTKAVAENAPAEAIAPSSSPWGDGCWGPSPACPESRVSHLLAPNSMVPPSATGAAPGQPGSLLKAMLRLRPFGQPGFCPGRGPGRWFFCGQPAAGPGLSPAVPPVKVVLELGSHQEQNSSSALGARGSETRSGAGSHGGGPAHREGGPEPAFPSPAFPVLFPADNKGMVSRHYNSAKLPPCGPPCSQEGRPPLTALREDRSSGVGRNQMRDKQQAKILP